MKVAVRIDVAESGSNGLVDEKHIGEFVPGSLIILQSLVILESVRADLHQCAVHGAAPRATVQPDEGSLAIGDVTILEMPEEKITVGFRVHLYMTFCFKVLVSFPLPMLCLVVMGQPR